MDVVALPDEEAVRLDGDLDQRAAGLALAGPGRPFPAPPQHLAVIGAARNLDFGCAAVRYFKTYRCAVDGVEKLDRQPIVTVGARCVGARLPMPPQQLGQEIVLF